MPAAAPELRAEIAAFARLHGRLAASAPTGTRASRSPATRSCCGAGAPGFGVEFDVNEAMRGRGLAHWLTDRSRPRGAGRTGRPDRALAARSSPLLCVVHPNNWSSGPSLWLDRLLAAVLPKTRTGTAAGAAEGRFTAAPPAPAVGRRRSRDRRRPARGGARALRARRGGRGRAAEHAGDELGVRRTARRAAGADRHRATWGCARSRVCASSTSAAASAPSLSSSPSRARP